MLNVVMKITAFLRFMLVFKVVRYFQNLQRWEIGRMDNIDNFPVGGERLS